MGIGPLNLFDDTSDGDTLRVIKHRGGMVRLSSLNLSQTTEQSQ
jgi:hypothetical protein